MTNKRLIVFYSKPYDEDSFKKANTKYHVDITFVRGPINGTTAIAATGYDAVCAFVNDDLSAEVLKTLAEHNIHLVAMRCAGYNNVDIEAAKTFGVKVTRVPSYSPYAVAEHAVALIMSLNRKTYRAYVRSKESNFSLAGLLGFDMYKKTVGVIGTGNIGAIFARIMMGFQCRVVAYDVVPNAELVALGVEYLPLDELYPICDIISLHVPLFKSTRQMINAESLAKMKDGVMLINTSRGALFNIYDVIRSLKARKIGYLGLDTYDKEAGIFFEDFSDAILHDDVLARLTTFPNVLVTAHQAFFTEEALAEIADSTLSNVKAFFEGAPLQNVVA
eukprot:CAMPEP_0184338296 /NCGR_PEP_ID=MMETSP1089-20130417/6816_1 /TAXON_ID=38269 ORGANISM="Gloeochaete wittrockiana, Strain SAG46.84" /NCGR_SAMPLE_ID=MMETSP1089 /ASSEMBLY_ACC=CAM_ASM_000445 /LENGTH=332 /DNA_ID=CAMNT_0026664713 /DNA_START=129 /DNA_END=1127 /DNA_ORIENTATION=-